MALINDEHHITRYIKPSRIGDDGKIDGKEFLVRPLDAGALSVNWVEYYECNTLEECIREIIEAKKATGYKLSRNGKYCLWIVGRVKAELQNAERHVDVVHDPLEDEPSHSLVRGYSPEDEIAAYAVARALEERIFSIE